MFARLFSERQSDRDLSTVKAREGAASMAAETRKNLDRLYRLSAERRRLANATRKYEARLHGRH